MILFLGDTSGEFAHRVKDKYPNAILVTDESMPVDDNGVVYTSQEDVSLENFIKLCQRSNKVHCDVTASPTIKEFYKLFFDTNEDSILDSCILEDARKTDETQIWALGCSYTSAVGVEQDQRWANRLAQKLNRNVSVLAAPRASIPWAGDQLLRSDVRKGDQVFWMLTTAHRIDYFSEDNQAVKIWPEIDPKELGRDEYSIMSKVLTHRWNVYLAVKTIKQAINYCNKVGATIHIAQAMRNDFETDRTLINTLKQHPGFIVDFSMELQYNKFMKDLGTDGQHPGPLTHNKIAEVFYKYVF